MWAMASGTAVVVLARERYRLVPWVVLFLALTWGSALFFGRATAALEAGPPGLVREVTSYITRVLYQETLFFLLPFYAYSTVPDSANVVFLGLLAGLAVLSCVDLLFDRWLRTRPVFALSFFALVAFAALNLLLPLLLGLRPRLAIPVAALTAAAGAGVLALRTAPRGWGVRLRLAGAGALIVGVVVGFPELIPPVPLRLEGYAFSTGMNRRTMTLPDTLRGRVPAARLDGSLVVVFEVFAPTALPATVQLEWRRDGRLVRTSRDVSITAHAAGFRVWDGWHPPSGAVPPGHYRVVLESSGRRVFGVARLVVE